MIGYCGGDEFRPLDGDVVDAVFHPDCLALWEQRLGPGYRFLAPEAARLWGVLILLASGHQQYGTSDVGV